MGAGPNKDKKFIQKIMSQLKEGNKELFIVDDKLGTPTYTYDFAANVKLLLEKEFWGLYNMVCGGITGRDEVAKELLNILGLINYLIEETEGNSSVDNEALNMLKNSRTELSVATEEVEKLLNKI